jgi:formylglycine-generating enzyme required for sulfatase activity
MKTKSNLLTILPFVLLAILFLASLSAQTITNVQVRQEGLDIIITYDMARELQKDDEIKVGYSTDGGRDYKTISGAEGDVGKNVKPGTGRNISFLANDALAGKNARFKVFVFSPPPGMVYVIGGTFQMGSSSESDEKPIHTVTVSSFFMDKTEVTQVQYRKVMGKNPSNFSGCDDCPVEQVTWYDANAYAQKVGKRLPTEAEWEYAARGGNKSKGYTYSGSNTIGSVAWYNGNSSSKTHPVAQKQPNELGLYDMSGNVWEWCSDRYDKGYYSRSPQTDPQGPNSGSFRVLRGGGWNDFYSYCRVAMRNWTSPSLRYSHPPLGFRLVLSQDL